jgi:hypothetical protein
VFGRGACHHGVHCDLLDVELPRLLRAGVLHAADDLAGRVARASQHRLDMRLGRQHSYGSIGVERPAWAANANKFPRGTVRDTADGSLVMKTIASPICIGDESRCVVPTGPNADSLVPKWLARSVHSVAKLI